MEGRVQRLRRAVIPPGPDELAWLSKLAERFDVELSPYASLVHEELFGTPFEELGETAALRASGGDLAAGAAESRRPTGSGSSATARSSPALRSSASRSSASSGPTGSSTSPATTRTDLAYATATR